MMYHCSTMGNMSKTRNMLIKSFIKSKRLFPLKIPDPWDADKMKKKFQFENVQVSWKVYTLTVYIFTNGLLFFSKGQQKSVLKKLPLDESNSKKQLEVIAVLLKCSCDCLHAFFVCVYDVALRELEKTNLIHTGFLSFVHINGDKQLWVHQWVLCLKKSSYF